MQYVCMYVITIISWLTNTLKFVGLVWCMSWEYKQDEKILFSNKHQQFWVTNQTENLLLLPSKLNGTSYLVMSDRDNVRPASGLKASGHSFNLMICIVHFRSPRVVLQGVFKRIINCTILHEEISLIIRMLKIQCSGYKLKVKEFFVEPSSCEPFNLWPLTLDFSYVPTKFMTW